MNRNVLVGQRNVEMFSVIMAEFGGLCPVLPFWWDGYECYHLLFLTASLVSFLLRQFFLTWRF